MSGEPQLTAILFVCMGNICRSPTGEGVMKHLVDQRELTEQVFVDSAGTIGYHAGHPADERMQQAARRRGYELTSVARQITVDDLQRFDLIIAMDRENLSDIRSLGEPSRATVCLLSDYLDDRWPTDVPDPYYGGRRGFEEVLDMIEAACPSILEALLSKSEQG